MGSGGVRAGAGRPKNSGKYGEETKPIRLPTKLVEQIEQLEDESQKHFFSDLHAILTQPAPEAKGAKSVVVRDILSRRQLARKYSNAIAASFGLTSALGQTSSSGSVDLHHLLIQKPDESFVVPVVGDSMNKAGIQDGDLLVVQRLTDAWTQLNNESIVVALVEGNETVKWFRKKGEKLFLAPESDNKDHKELELKEDMDVHILGIVLYSIHSTHRNRRF